MKFENLTRTEIEEYIGGLEQETTRCPFPRLREINAEIDEARRVLESGTFKAGRQNGGNAMSPQLRAELNGEPVGRSAGLGTVCLLSTYATGQGQVATRGLVTPEDRAMRYANDVEERRATPEYRLAFFRTLLGKATLEERALVTTATGAAVIPTTTLNEIIENVQKTVGFLGLCRILSIPGNLSIPVSDINTPATWHVEGAPIADSSVPPNNVTLAGFELAKLFSMSAATQAMSIAAFEGYLVAELTRCTREALADAALNGVGTTQPLGVLNGFVWGVTNSVSGAAAVVWETLIDGLRLLPSNYRQNAVLVVNSTTFYDRIVKYTDAAGNPLFTERMTAGAPLTFLGKRVVLDDLLADDVAIWCDPSFYFINFSSPMTIERSTDAGFTTATIMYRSLAVVDGKPVAPAFVKVTITS